MSMDSDRGGLGAAERAEDPARLVRQYEEGSSFLLASPGQTLLARGMEATVPKMGCSNGSWPVADRVAGFFDNALDFGRRNPVVVGAIPFDDNLPAHLVLPTEVVRAGSLAAPRSASGTRELLSPEWTVRSAPGPEEYLRGIRRVLPRIERGELDAVMLGRCLEFTAPRPVDPVRALRELSARTPNGGSFAVALPRRGEDGSRDSYGPRPELERTLLGSSPGLLVSRRGTTVTATPTAGSLPRGRDDAEDRERAARLLTSQRHRREHALAVSSMVDALAPLCQDVRVADEPAVSASAAAWHLRTEITAQLRDPAISSLTVATAVHPASAVSGAPAKPARSVSAETEPFERGFFCGLVGWCDPAGDGDWMAADQSAEIEHDTLRLFAGSGIVAGCDPDAELTATTASLRTVMSALCGDEHP